MFQKLRFFSILPLFFYNCGVMESEYKPDIAVEIEHNLPVIDGVPTLTLNQNMWQNIHYIDFKVTLDGRPAEYSSFSFNSNLFWFIGDTNSYGKKNCLECSMYTIGDHSENIHDPVPTSNYRSLTDSDGETRNAIAPVSIMKGETYKLWWDVWVTGSMEGREGTIDIKLN